MRMLFSIFNLALLMGCNSNEEKVVSLSEQTKVDSLETSKPQKSAVPFDNQKSFEITNAVPGITKASSSPDTSMCKVWTLTIKQAAQIIKDAEPIDGTRWDLEFLVLPCIVEGKLRQEG